MSAASGHRILAIDQGTSGTKAIVVADGVVLGLAEVPVRPDYLADGGVEVEPSELLDSVLEAGRAAMAQAGGRVDVIALANQGETVLAWDEFTGEPLSRALVWQDSRAQGICGELSELSDFIADRTGLVLDPYFTAPKLAWLRRHVTRDGVVTTSDTWLLHQLTGEFVTDVSTASRSLLLDVDTREWDTKLIDAFGLAGEKLPRIAANDEVIGTTSAFGAATPVGGIIVDQQAALFAQGCHAPGEAKCTYGTGAFLLMNTGDRAPRSRTGLTTSVAWAVRDRTAYCLDGQVYTAASAIRWLADLGLIGDVRELDGACADSSDDVLFVPALAGLAAPWWRADARASFSGMSLGTGRGELVRAVIEGIAATVADLVVACETDLGAPLSALRVDGGLTASRALMQVQADLLQVPVEVYPSPHATALGAAALGRLAIDADAQADVQDWVPSAVFEPQWSPDRAAQFLGRWRAEVANSLHDVNSPGESA